MAADTGDKWYESLQSTHSYCKMEKKKKIAPRLFFGSCVFIFPMRLGKAEICPAVVGGRGSQGKMQGLWAAEGCVPPLPCPATSPGTTATAHGNISGNGKSFADYAYDVKLQAFGFGG